MGFYTLFGPFLPMSDSRFIVKDSLPLAALDNSSFDVFFKGLPRKAEGGPLEPSSFFVFFLTFAWCDLIHLLPNSSFFFSPPLQSFWSLLPGSYRKLEGRVGIGRMKVNRRLLGLDNWAGGHLVWESPLLLAAEAGARFVTEGERAVLTLRSHSPSFPPFLVFHWLLCEPTTLAKTP